MAHHMRPLPMLPSRACRGLFRIPGTKWQHPADVVPPGSSKDSGGGAMRSPLARDAARDVWEAELRIKRRMAPLHLAFDITLPGVRLGGVRHRLQEQQRQSVAAASQVQQRGRSKLPAQTCHPLLLAPLALWQTSGPRWGRAEVATLWCPSAWAWAWLTRWAPHWWRSPRAAAPTRRAPSTLRCGHGRARNAARQSSTCSRAAAPPCGRVAPPVACVLLVAAGAGCLPTCPRVPPPRPPRPPQVFSRHARSMCLCVLRRDGGGYLEVGLDPAAQRTGDVWHIQLQGLRNVGGLVYGWRAGGDKSWAGAEGGAAAGPGTPAACGTSNGAAASLAAGNTSSAPC